MKNAALKVFKNKNFTKRDYECTNLVYAVGETQPEGDFWEETNDYKEFRQPIYQILRPFFFCAECMSSVHGLIIYVGAYCLELHTFNLYFAPIFCIVLLGTMFIVTSIIEYLYK